MGLEDVINLPVSEDVIEGAVSSGKSLSPSNGNLIKSVHSQDMLQIKSRYRPIIAPRVISILRNAAFDAEVSVASDIDGL
jgi:hypothetical protein